MRSSLSFLLLAATVAGCGAKTPAPETTTTQAALPAAANGDVLTGPVLEQIAAPPYVYLRIKTAQGEIWAAVPEATIETGTVVTLANSMLMSDFESKSLNRTFDRIYFGTLAPEGGAMAATAGNPHAGLPQSAATVDVGQVEKAAGADAQTVAEIWARKASLEGKTVTVRGVVVKANDGVMGKNWIHLQDGSGEAGQGTNDITVTTLDRAAKGTTVTIRGTVRTNRDFGAGYAYAVMVEDARVVQ
jgi:hypothetical protein